MPPMTPSRPPAAAAHAAARDPEALCARSIHIMASGDLPDSEDVIHPKAVNHEARREPPRRRGRAAGGAVHGAGIARPQHPSRHPGHTINGGRDEVS
jgi:hypothetical protein